jgi:hypothetical protein
LKRHLLLALTVFFPYSILFAIVCIFNGYFAESLFQNYGVYVFRTLFILYLAALICSVVSFIIGIVRKWSGEELLRTNMIIKLIHIPAYVLVFIIGLVNLIRLFTYLLYENYCFALTIILMVLNCMTIILTGLIGLCGVIRSYKENKFSRKEVFIHGFLQFVFCVDVISSIIAYKKARSQALTGENHT